VDGDTPHGMTICSTAPRPRLNPTATTWEEPAGFRPTDSTDRKWIAAKSVTTAANTAEPCPNLIRAQPFAVL